MISAQAQEMLDTLERAQNRLVLWMAAGFAVGFVIGFVVAWTMAHP